MLKLRREGLLIFFNKKQLVEGDVSSVGIHFCDRRTRDSLFIIKFTTYAQIIHLKPNALKIIIKLASVALMSLA